MEVIKQPEHPKVIDCSKITSKDWFAWINMMPPGPSAFHARGLIQVSSPGIIAMLVYREPQGINPNILFLDLVLIQRPGVWPRVVTWVEARYNTTEVGLRYTDVNVFCGDKMIIEMPVQIIH